MTDNLLDPEPLTPAEQNSIRYQQIVKKYEPGCACGPCRVIALFVNDTTEGR